METHRLTEFSQVAALYRSRVKKDFARNERKPLRAMRRSWDEGSYECYGLFDGDEIIGYAFFVRHGETYLFDYLAIAEEHRSEGYGSLFLRQLADCLQGASCVIGEVEHPEKAPDEDARLLRERRLRFYLRSGYLKTDVTSQVFGVDYQILEVPTGAPHSAEEIRQTYDELYRKILPPFFYQTQFKVI